MTLLDELLFVFFFQAEDGIRDTSVTGVQTCALPISGPFAPPRHPDEPVPPGGNPALPPPARILGPSAPHRSEERRVGKECRARWLRYDVKKEERQAGVRRRYSVHLS